MMSVQDERIGGKVFDMNTKLKSKRLDIAQLGKALVDQAAKINPKAPKPKNKKKKR